MWGGIDILYNLLLHQTWAGRHQDKMLFEKMRQSQVCIYYKTYSTCRLLFSLLWVASVSRTNICSRGLFPMFWSAYGKHMALSCFKKKKKDQNNSRGVSDVIFSVHWRGVVFALVDSQLTTDYICWQSIHRVYQVQHISIESLISPTFWLL